MPEIVLAVWGLLVLMADLTRPFRHRDKRRGGRARPSAGFALAGMVARSCSSGARPALRSASTSSARHGWLNFAGIDYFESHPDPFVFFGTISDDLLTEGFNLLYVILLALVIRLSMVWSFTDDWGEYFALLCWSTVGMMLLTAAEELLTLFVTLETMTICLYLLTAFEKDKRRSAEGGLKYFVYGSVSSAALPVREIPEPRLRPERHDSPVRRDPRTLMPSRTFGDYTGLAGNLVPGPPRSC